MLTTITTLLPNAIIATDRQTLTEALLGLLPIFIFLVVVFFLLRRAQRSPVAKLQKEYFERQLQQMPRIEALLERIAKALERNN
jgi:hypothetical protein